MTEIDLNDQVLKNLPNQMAKFSIEQPNPTPPSPSPKPETNDQNKSLEQIILEQQKIINELNSKLELVFKELDQTNDQNKSLEQMVSEQQKIINELNSKLGLVFKELDQINDRINQMHFPPPDPNNNYPKKIEKFEDMNLKESLLHGIYSYGFQYPSEIQQLAIKPIVQCRNVIAQAQSGTGKTGAFSIGILQRIDLLSKTTQALIISPALNHFIS